MDQSDGDEPFSSTGGSIFLEELSSSPFLKGSAPWRQPGTVLEIKLCILHRFVVKDKVTRWVGRVVQKDVKSSAKMGDPLA